MLRISLLLETGRLRYVTLMLALPQPFALSPLSQNLQRELGLVSKNHAQEVKSLHLRQRELLKQLQSVREEGNQVKLLLKVGNCWRYYGNSRS